MTEEQLHNTIKICDLICEYFGIAIKEDGKSDEREKLLNVAKILHKVYIYYDYYFFESELQAFEKSLLEFLLNFGFFPDDGSLFSYSYVEEDALVEYMFNEEAPSREMLGGDLWTGVEEYKICGLGKMINTSDNVYDEIFDRCTVYLPVDLVEKEMGGEEVV